ncbi:hypothetical protein CKAH01_18732 [Colletotrichum kahawae]|uniref:Uncharacterized protein n=1 Tax=Colletotrichum kahawae TaxID=34407 RepID=A0AAD9Y651_COLKA|nr:hypothetical protein CKAH01_18732 [Colletotrichum kahawae]
MQLLPHQNPLGTCLQHGGLPYFSRQHIATGPHLRLPYLQQ